MADNLVTYKAVADRTVLDPATNRPIPDDGIEVFEHDAYWWRKWRDGDVTLDGLTYDQAQVLEAETNAARDAADAKAAAKKPAQAAPAATAAKGE